MMVATKTLQPSLLLFLLVTLTSDVIFAWAFTSPAAVAPASSRSIDRRFLALSAGATSGLQESETQDGDGDDLSSTISRRGVLLKTILTAAGIPFVTVSPTVAFAEDGDADESFASIAARASRLSVQVGDQQAQEYAKKAAIISGDPRTIYDFAVPVQGDNVPLSKLIPNDDDANPVKAIIVVNMKEDDPIARKDIPELMSLASRFRRESNSDIGQVVVLLCPTDQGYYEPDTSALIRLKLASEYGYGISKSTLLTDKINLLGNSAHPMWRWLQNTCRTPAGLGRLQGNYEKFLVDARTGRPVRRYPRKYAPSDMRNDVEALVNSRPLPPPGADFQEKWRAAAVEGERDTYRFQKGLNYFDV